MQERPLEELKQLLAERFDEVDLLELLQVNSFELVEAFSDCIEENQDKFNKELDALEFNELEDE